MTTTMRPTSPTPGESQPGASDIRRHSAQDPRYFKQWRVDRDRGIQRTVPAEPVRAHILRLIQQVSLCSVADAAQVSKSTLHNIRMGRSRRVNRDIAARVTGVSLEDVYRRQDRLGFVPNIGARRRIQALLALGWRHQDISHRMTTGTSSAVVLHQIGDWITRDTHDAVVAVYEELSAHRGPSEATRRRSHRLGYLPPLWWDDDTIDDPAHDPLLVDHIKSAAIPDRGKSAKDNLVDGPSCHDFVDPIAVERVIAGDRTVTLNRTEKHAAVLQLLTAGKGITDVARRLHMSGRYVRIYAERAGLDPTNPSWSRGTITATPDQLEEATA